MKEEKPARPAADADAPQSMETFDDVILELNSIIRWSIREHRRFGYFAALYKNITILVKLAAEAGYFEDRHLLEKLDVFFARRYFDALASYKQQRLPASSPWYPVFQANETRRLTIVQHLLMSVNVHINYDLPIVCADLGPDEKILRLCNDYFALNTIIASSFSGVEKGIFRLSPVISLLARTIPKLERKLLNFSLNVARCKSWECACKQAIARPGKRAGIIQASAGGTNKLTSRVVNPGMFANLATFFIRLFEFYGIRQNIQILDQSLLRIIQAQMPEVITPKP